ncbi:hypothetical protein ACPV5R_00885 [Vibrio astriarenae]
MRYFISLSILLLMIQGCGGSDSEDLGEQEGKTEISGSISEISDAIASGALEGADTDATVILPEGEKLVISSTNTGNLTISGLVTIK